MIHQLPGVLCGRCEAWDHQ